MLYISRMLGQTKVVVVDTDDGLETIITYRELHDYVTKLGIEIQGIETAIELNRFGQRKIIKGVSVYQPADTVTREQTKLKVLRGVDVKTFNGKIMSVSLESETAGKVIRLRLSDYGSECGECIFLSMPVCHSSSYYVCNIVAVLDDKIKLNSRSLNLFFEHGVVIDTSEVRNKATVELVCKEISRSYKAVKFINEMVFDSDVSRMDYYKAFALLAREYNTDPQLDSLIGFVKDADTVSDIVSKRFRAEFISLADSELRKSPQKRMMNEAIILYRTFSLWDYKSYIDSADFSDLKRDDFIRAFDSMREMTSCNKAAITRFKNYIKYFIVTPELQNAYIRLLHNVLGFINAYGYSRGWPRG